MSEDDGLPGGEEAREIPSRPRWWVPLLVLLLGGALLALYIPRLLPEERTGYGTGFAIREGGYILTAAHVVRGATEIGVRWEGHRYPATAIALSAEHDLALLLAEGIPAIPAAVLAGDRPRVGDEVTAVGHPTGAARPVPLLTRVSGVGGWAVGPEGAVLRDLITTQNPFRPGYSGSPLVNEAGQVVGLVTGNATAESGPEFGFAMSIHRVADWLAGRGMTLPLQGGSTAVALSEEEQGDAIWAAVVRVEAQFPPGAR